MSAWSGLGINATQPFGSYWTRYPSAVSNNSDFVNLILQNFSRIRCITKTNELTETEGNPGGTQGAAPAHRSWVGSVKAVSPTFPILYGIYPGGDVKYYPPHYVFYKARMLIEAAWAEANGMDGFQVGNEHEVSHASLSYLMTVTSLSRTSNVVTAVFPSVHGLTTGDEITVSGATPADFNVADSVANPTSVVVTVINTTTVTYPSTGSDGEATGTLKMGWSYHQERLKVKEDIEAAQAVFSGTVSYACSQGYQSGWITDGIPVGSKISFNIYGNAGNNNFATFKSTLDACWAEFGTDMFLTELNASDPGTWNNSSIDGVTPSSRNFYPLWEKEILKRVAYARGLGVEEIYIYAAWTIQNNFALFYNEGTHNGQPTGTLDLEATFQGQFLPVVKQLSSKRRSSVFMGSMESQ